MDVLFDLLFNFSSEELERGQMAVMLWLALAVALSAGVKALLRKVRSE